MTKRPDDPRVPESREQAWRRLETYLERCRKSGVRSLTDVELEQFGKLYRAAATHLALQREFGVSERLRERLNRLVSDGHRYLYSEEPKRRRLPWVRFFLGFPEVVRATWRFHALAAMLLLLGSLYGYLGSLADPEWTLELTFGGDTRTPYASREELLSSLHTGRSGEVAADEKAAFAAMLWSNNTKVAIFALFLGAAFGVLTAALVFYNGVLLGAYTYTFVSRDLTYEWFAWLLPHGVTELLAVILLSGCGLWLGKNMLAPRHASRAETFLELGPAIFKVALFAFPMMFVAALIESYLRQSPMGDGPRYVFAVVSALFWILYLGFGKVPRKVVDRALGERSVAETVVPLPKDLELLQLARAPR